MDLESTLSTIAATIPQEVTEVITQAVSYIPDNLRDSIRSAATYLPTEIDFITMAQFLLYFTAASLVLGTISRVVLGKQSSLNRSLSSVMAVLFIYTLTIVVYTFKPWKLDILLSPLPFTSFSGSYLIIHPITDLQFTALCTQVLSLLILCFLINLVGTLVPAGDGILAWLLLRLITIFTCFALHLGVNWAFNTYLPHFLVAYAPTILLCVLAVMLLSGAASLVLGLVIAITNPFLGAMYSFFFSNVVGKQISKAIFTTSILCGILWLMDYFGLVVILITPAALLTYIPLALAMLVLWFLIGHLL
jgi:hypothetical protein